MSVESIQPGRLLGAAGYLARVRLPDDTEQDVELGCGRAGELEARLIDGAACRSPEVRLDFTQGATPRVTWFEPDGVPLATSLQIVGKVCDALARAAGGLEPISPASIAVMQVDVEPVRRANTKLYAAVGLLAVSAVAGVAVLLLRPAEMPAAVPSPVVASAPTIAPPTPSIAPPPPAPTLPAPTPIAVAAPKAEAVAVAAAPHRRGHRHRGFRLLRQSVQHGVGGLAPGTGLVAVRTEPGLEVAVDGLWVGMTPVHPLALSEGSHVLELRRSGKHAETLELGVAAGDKATLFLRYE